MKHQSLLAPLLLLAVACSTPPGGIQDAPRDENPPEFEFRLGPGDRVRLSVWGEEETLEHDLELGPDGSASFPLIGDVPLQGLTLDEARVEVAQRLKGSLLLDPVVSVSLVTMRSHVIHVLGEVRRPGSVPYVRGASALGAVQAAGSFRPGRADISDVRVVRGRMGKHRAYRVDMEKVLAGEGRDMWLQPGDVIYVPPRAVTEWGRWWRQFLWEEPLEPGK